MARRLALLLSLFIPLSLIVHAQTTPLSVLEAGPTGRVAQLSDASEIRVIFSEPMVALGRAPSNPAIPWVTISPRLPGTFRWSGTTILIFTPDSSTPVPYATKFTVTVSADAVSASGKRLGTPYRFEFTTPTVQLLSAEWYRRDGRADRPAVIALKFNQRVRPADIAAHVTARYQPHDWEAPEFSEREIARFRANDPAALAAFDAKVAATRRTVSSTAPIRLRVATDWDKERFPAADAVVVMETVTPPSPEGWIEVTLDATAPSPAGSEVRGEPTRSTIELEPAFFVRPMECQTDCAPAEWNPVVLTRDVSRDAFAAALSIRDITNAAAEKVVGKSAASTPSRENDTRASFNVEDAGFERQAPVTTWRLRLDPSLRAADGQTLGYTWIGVVENAHERAFVSFGDGHGVWERSGGTTLPFSSRNFATVRQSVTRLGVTDLMPKILELQPKEFEATLDTTAPLRRLPVTPDAIQAHGMDLSSVLSGDGTGLALAAVQPGDVIPRATTSQDKGRATIVQATNLGLSVKDSPQNTLVFVTRLDTGVPVPSARVAIVGLENRRMWEGTTNADGIALAPALPLRNRQNPTEFAFIVTAEKDGDVAYLGSNWTEGIEPWYFDIPYGIHEAEPLLRGSVFTDRGVYKPGEEVHVKAIVRADTPNGIRMLPAGAALKIRVHDARDRLVDERTVTTGAWSSAEWTWTVPESSALGQYRIETEWANAPANTPGAARQANGDDDRSWLRTVYGQFLVAAYRKPDFRVDAKLLPAQAPIAGVTLGASSVSQYLFGSPLANRPVRWTVTRESEYGVPVEIRDRYPTFVFGREDDEPSSPTTAVAGDTATTDASGTFRVDVATERETDRAYRYTFESEVEDVSRHRIANRSSVVVYPAALHVGLARSDQFAVANTPTEVRVIAVGPNGEPAPGTDVTLALMRVQWNSVRTAQGDGFYEWETERTEVPAGTWTVTSGAAPIAARIDVGEGGSYLLRATARDAQGRTTATETSFYAVGAGYTAWERFDHNRITLTPERTTWKPGERARVLIQSPWESATGLLTVEREGVRRHERFALTSTQQTVEIPITEEDIPNVYVSVLLVRGRTSNDFGRDGSDPGKPAFRLGYAELKVEDAAKALTVSVAADREEYRPANDARVTVKVADVSAKPVASEVTLWAVDYGVLSLTDYAVPDVLKSVYQDKVLQVMTEDSRQRIVSRRVLTPKGETDGGGGGFAPTRQDFRPLAFWLGSVVTNADGTATVSVKLPESLTTYRILAVAGDAASRFGEALADIKVSKPVTLIAAFPRFLNPRDSALLGAAVTNTLGTGGSARVTIRSLDPTVVELAGASEQVVDLAPGATVNVRFPAVARQPGTARVQMSVALGENSDAFELPLPVRAVARLETSAAFGDTTDRAEQSLTLPAGVQPMTGSLAIDLASTAMVGLSTGAQYVVQYPYGCAEQKTSAALTYLLAADLGRAFTLGDVNPADYRQRATQILADMVNFQCRNGGYSLWGGAACSADPYLTAYILHVIKIGADLGVTPDQPSVDRALDYLKGQLGAPAPQQVQWLPVWGASQAYGVKVLAEYGRNQDSNITRLVGMADRLPVFALSYLLDALAAGNDRGPRYAGLLARVTNALRVEGDQAHVQELNEDALAWIWHSNARATAVVLSGLVRRGDNPLLVPNLVRWLNSARTDGHWGSTQANATTLEAMVRYYRAFESETPDMTASVTLGARAIGTARFQGRSTAAQELKLAMPDLLRMVEAGATEPLVVSKSGTGRLYYSTRLQYTLPESSAAIDQGMRVERHYEPFVENGSAPPATSFAAGDLVRVVLRVTLPQERRYVAVSDPVPAGFEPVDGWFRTTAADLASQSLTSSDDAGGWWRRWQRGGFDHVERHDDRVLLFGTRLADGTHEYSYLVRATTAGTFTAPGTWVEEMYAPEVNGRSASSTVTIR